MSQNEDVIRTPETRTEERAAHRKTGEAAERAVGSAFELGRVWARYGLSIGKMALETSATSLKTTATLLGAVAETFAEPEGERAQRGPSDAPTA